MTTIAYFIYKRTILIMFNYRFFLQRTRGQFWQFSDLWKSYLPNNRYNVSRNELVSFVSASYMLILRKRTILVVFVWTILYTPKVTPYKKNISCMRIYENFLLKLLKITDTFYIVKCLKPGLDTSTCSGLEVFVFYLIKMVTISNLKKE